MAGAGPTGSKARRTALTTRQPETLSSYSFSLRLACAGALSFLLCAWRLCLGPPLNPAAAAAFYSQVPPLVHAVPMVAMFTTALLNVLSWALEFRPAKRQLSFLAAYISGTAFTLYLLSWWQLAPIITTTSSSGRPVSIFRYFMWLHATPAMLYTLSLMSDFSNRRVGRLLAMDVIMIGSAILGALSGGGRAYWLWFALSFLSYPYVFWELWAIHGAVVKESQEAGAVAPARALQLFTVSIWSCFPVVWTLSNLEVVGPQGEELLWACVDTISKVVFSSSLLHSNFSDLEERRARAIRMVEGANRWQAERELRAVLEQKEQFVDSTSQELRTPLLSILGLADQLLDRPPSSYLGASSLVAAVAPTRPSSPTALPPPSPRPLEGLARRPSTLAMPPSTIHAPWNGSGPSSAPAVVAPLPPDAARVVVSIRDNGAWLLNLVDDLLDAAALQKGALALRMGSVDLAALVQKVLGLARPLARPGVSVANRVSPFLPPARADAARLVQALYHLLTNACKFTEAGSIWVDASLSGEQGLALSVHDTGIGIPSALLGPIFNAFQQADMSSSRQYGGMGLGLSLARQLVEAQGGTLSVTSREGQGSTFTLQLQIWGPSDEAQAEAFSAAGPSKQGGAALRQQAQQAAAARGPQASPGDWGVVRTSLTSFEEGPATPLAHLEPLNPARLGHLEQGVRKELLQHLLALQPAGPEPAALSQRTRSAPLPSRSQDAELAAMLRRLSVGSNCRRSLEQGRRAHSKAPQQLSPAAALAAFTSATAPLAPACPGQPQRAQQRLTWQEAEEDLGKRLAQGGVQVLCADDDPVHQEVVQRALCKAGFRVAQAADGPRVLQMLEDMLESGAPPAALLLSTRMPYMGGYEVLRRVRKEHPLLALPIILLSSQQREEDAAKALQGGAVDYILKPVRPGELAARLRSHLRAHLVGTG